MSLTLEELQATEFERKMRGYNPTEVDAFKLATLEKIQALENENRELTEKVQASTDKLKYLNDLKDSLNKSILVAQEAAAKVKSNAEREANITLQEAQQEAERIIQAANQRVTNVYKEAADTTTRLKTASGDLKTTLRVFKQRLQVMIESQLEVVNGQDWEQLLADDDFTQLAELEKILAARLDNNSVASVKSSATNQTTDQAVAAETPATAPTGETVVVFPDDEK